MPLQNSAIEYNPFLSFYSVFLFFPIRCVFLVPLKSNVSPYIFDLSTNTFFLKKWRASIPEVHYSISIFILKFLNVPGLLYVFTSHLNLFSLPYLYILLFVLPSLQQLCKKLFHIFESHFCRHWFLLIFNLQNKNEIIHI